jgi:hypothetical protein
MTMMLCGFETLTIDELTHCSEQEREEVLRREAELLDMLDDKV